MRSLFERVVAAAATPRGRRILKRRSFEQTNLQQIFYRSKATVALPDLVEDQREQRKKVEREQALEEASKGQPSFAEMLKREGLWPLTRKQTKILQVNVGKLCNQTCHHCHVEAGPTKTRENMNKETAERVVKLLSNTPSIDTIDLTGGAPELNPHFKYLVSEANRLGKSIIDRCNLTVLLEPNQEQLAEFLAQNNVTVVASLPCYTPKNVELQRGKGVFEKSIQALVNLNKLGYGKEGSNLMLNLVYNPVGPYLPGAQQKLEEDYKRELKAHMNIEFNNLFTITNMPIKRFADALLNNGNYLAYMALLVNHFNAGTVDHVMCRDLVSIGWDGTLYDCDFNQMLEIDIGAAKSRKLKSMTIWQLESFNLEHEPIATQNHCYGCTAGSGSSCGGSLT